MGSFRHQIRFHSILPSCTSRPSFRRRQLFGNTAPLCASLSELLSHPDSNPPSIALLRHCLCLPPSLTNLPTFACFFLLRDRERNTSPVLPLPPPGRRPRLCDTTSMLAESPFQL